MKKTDIINARQSDNALFHRPLRKQKGQCHKFIDELNVGQSTYSDENIIDGWYKHFKGLATKNVNDNFDLKFLKQVQEEFPVIYRNCLDSSANPEPVTDKEITDAVKSLNRGKAPDEFGITAEHISGGRDVINTSSVKFLINRVLFNKEVLSDMIPIFKNKGSSKDSQNYRGITITPVLTKILETILKARTQPILME